MERSARPALLLASCLVTAGQAAAQAPRVNGLVLHPITDTACDANAFGAAFAPNPHGTGAYNLTRDDMAVGIRQRSNGILSLRQGLGGSTGIDDPSGVTCAHVGARLLAQTKIPAALQGASCDQDYAEVNSLLDLVVGGCERADLGIDVIFASQPDQSDPDAPPAGAGASYVLSADPGTRIVDGCLDSTGASVALAECLADATYSSHLVFTTSAVPYDDVVFKDGFDPATEGSIRITTVTTGVARDPDGYTARIGPNDYGLVLPSNGSTLFTYLRQGSQTVELGDLAANCSTTDNPRRVTVTAGETTDVQFAITCVTPSGSIRVTAATTGSAPDSDGYSAQIGITMRPVAANGSVIVGGLAPGLYRVELSGLAAHCSTTGNPRVVTVTQGATAETTFDVACPGGTLRVTTVTTGGQPDPSGYNLFVMGQPVRAIGVNATAEYAGLPAGSYDVQLGGLAANCSTGTNLRTVPVVPDAIASTTFNVWCPAAFTLSVTRNGTGTGTVTSNPAGINCGNDCTNDYNEGTLVTLTANPASGSTFSGWSGGGCAGTGTCTVTLTAATTVTATFALSDVTAPTLTSSSPADGAIGVASDATIRLTFSEAMDKPATEAAFQVTSPSGVGGTFTWSGNTMLFTPSQLFLCYNPATVVRWSLSTAARDLAGNPIASTISRSFDVIRCVGVTLIAENTRDGYIRSTGTVDAGSASIYVGDYADESFARGFVSFDFSSVPGNAVIGSTHLQMNLAKVGSPSQLGDLIAEPVAYGTLGSGDFSLAAHGTPTIAACVDTLCYWQLDETMLDAWENRATQGTRLQLRLRTTIDYVFGGADAYNFMSTEGGGASQAPRLGFTYRVP
jgi:hypothetical protein